MKKVLLFCLLALSLFAPASFAANIPDNVKHYVNGVFPNTYFRFDGLIILPDNTVYMPLFPARMTEPEKLSETGSLSKKGDVVIFNNGFVLLKVIYQNGHYTFAPMSDPPAAVRSGLLPQDILTPPNFVVPDNLKGIKGNLHISEEEPLRTAAMAGIKPSPLPGKTFYIITPRNKNIQTTDGWAITQKRIPFNIKLHDDRFLLVTSFGSRVLDMISIADGRVIKQIEFKSNPEEIVIDKKNKLAYVATPQSSDVYVINLVSMTLLKQIKVGGMCEKMTLSADGTKLFYYDKKTRDIMAVELNNNYLIRDLGRFPNVSKIAYAGGKVYITGRTSNRLAIIDYGTVGLIAEVEIAQKPLDMLVFGGNLFILSQNELQVLDVATDRITNNIHLSQSGFLTMIVPVDGTDLGVITDVVQPVCVVVNLATKQIVKTSTLGITAGSMVVGSKINALYSK